MMRKDYIRMHLIVALTLLALGGWLLHARIHPVSKDAENAIPLVSGLISIVLVPLLFCIRRTIPFAYLINGMTVIIGTITMAHFSVEHPPEAWTLRNVLIGTLLADIALLLGKFGVGQALLEIELDKGAADAPMSKGRFFRYPRLGFWLAHLVAMTVLYLLGHEFWE